MENKFEIGQKVIDDIFFGDNVIGEIMDIEYGGNILQY